MAFIMVVSEQSGFLVVPEAQPVFSVSLFVCLSVCFAHCKWKFFWRNFNLTFFSEHTQNKKSRLTSIYCFCIFFKNTMFGFLFQEHTWWLSYDWIAFLNFLQESMITLWMPHENFKIRFLHWNTFKHCKNCFLQL